MTAQADPFDTLGLPARFDLTDAQIERAYLARVATAHPDAAGPSGGGDGHDPASLNRARTALLDREKRAAALLARFGGPSASDDKSLPDGFLMEIMETRGEIEEAIASGGEAERERWEMWAEERREEFTAEVAMLFDRAAAGEAGVLPEIRRRLNAWRYIERLIEQLDPDYDPARADFGR